MTLILMIVAAVAGAWLGAGSSPASRGGTCRSEWGSPSCSPATIILDPSAQRDVELEVGTLELTGVKLAIGVARQLHPRRADDDRRRPLRARA